MPSSPEAWVVPPAAGGECVPAFSRYYAADGSFSWAPCSVLEYSRCAAEHCTRTA
jgi:hypothetical protein